MQYTAIFHGSRNDIHQMIISDYHMCLFIAPIYQIKTSLSARKLCDYYS